MLAIQFGYLPGLVWLVVGVCLAGAVQDMMVLAASTRRDGLSLAGLARAEIGRPAGLAAAIAILYIVIIALAGLGIVVVKALGGEEVRMKAGTRARLSRSVPTSSRRSIPNRPTIHHDPAGLDVSSLANETRPDDGHQRRVRPDGPGGHGSSSTPDQQRLGLTRRTPCDWCRGARGARSRSPARFRSRFSSAGTCTGCARARFSRRRCSARSSCWPRRSAVLRYRARSSSRIFRSRATATVFALAAYGFVAAVLPVWLLLCPRDYLSTFLKIGTILLLVGGRGDRQPQAARPGRQPLLRSGGGPYFDGPIFPYVFICIMCGAISGFHALVASGTTPKMVDRESDVRMIGYGAMLMEGLVGVVALIAAAALPNSMYYDINIDLARRPDFLAKHRDFAQFLQAGDDDVHGGHAAGGAAAGSELVAMEKDVRGVAARPDRRGRHAGRRHGADLFRRHSGHELADQVLVSLRDHVRGAFHPDDDRRRHADRAVPGAGVPGQDLEAAGRPELAARLAPGDGAGRLRLGLLHLHRQRRDDLADVRHGQPACWR